MQNEIRIRERRERAEYSRDYRDRGYRDRGDRGDERYYREREDYRGATDR